jgi:hypothetical protein
LLWAIGVRVGLRPVIARFSAFRRSRGGGRRPDAGADLGDVRRRGPCRAGASLDIDNNPTCHHGPTKERRGRYAAPLVDAVDLCGVLLTKAERFTEAAAVFNDGVALTRELAARDPVSFGPKLANALWSVAWVRATGGSDLIPALVAIDEAAQICQAGSDSDELLNEILLTAAAVLAGLHAAATSAQIWQLASAGNHQVAARQLAQACLELGGGT